MCNVALMLLLDNFYAFICSEPNLDSRVNNTACLEANSRRNGAHGGECGKSLSTKLGHRLSLVSCYRLFIAMSLPLIVYLICRAVGTPEMDRGEPYIVRSGALYKRNSI